MGGLNSSFTVKTKRVLLFVQTYNKQLIRRTSMLTGQRTIAATYFERDWMKSALRQLLHMVSNFLSHMLARLLQVK